MKQPHAIHVAVCCQTLLLVSAVSAEPIAEKTIHAAVNKAIPLIQRSATQYLEERTCFSCHHQAATLITLTDAARHGFEVDADVIEQQRKRVVRFLKSGQKRFQDGRGTGGRVGTAGYALWALDVVNHKHDDLTGDVVKYLLGAMKDDAYWPTPSRRPPTMASHFTATYVALRGLNHFGTKDHRREIGASRKQALAWLVKTKPTDTEEHVFRLRSFEFVEPDDATFNAAADALLKLQRPDGGWSQKPDMKSDAYATATALVALHRVGRLSHKDDAYQRGLRFLLDSQNDDGSWHVKTRSKPIQSYFESGFPHGKDQFVSMHTTCWSALALVLACPQSVSR